MRRNFRQAIHRGLTLLSLSAFLASSSSAYYYYVHYDTSSGAYTPIVEKFDLNALQNNTVPFFISGQGPSKLLANDSFLAIISEIRSAAAVWNNVSTSTLRLAYGGLFTIGVNESAPEIHIEFSTDIPPGLLALSGPETEGTIKTDSTGRQFVPIVRSKMLLRADLSQQPGPSYSELFFTTVVHEFGHTIGLQHSLTSSVMSTAVTSAASKAIPLASDDIAGISLLYPAAGYAGSFGTIKGRVTLANGNGKGVGLASVVAIAPGSAPVSALTNPDGTYEIDGLAPLQYYVYAHPLPPAELGESYPANILPPLDLKGNALASGADFVTQFYPGTRDFNQAQLIPVTQGNTTGGIEFTVTKEDQPAISSVRVYGYSSDNVPLSAPQLFAGVPAALVAAGASGLLNSDGSIPSNLAVSTLGNPAQVYNLQPYYAPYLSFDVDVNDKIGAGPQHLLFSTSNDLYVLPCAFAVALNPPPFITKLTPGFDSNGRRTVTVTGNNLQPDTRILFDGLPATILSITSDGKFVVAPPPAPSSYTAMVAALNTSDPQSSLFLQPTPLSYTYDSAGTPGVTASPQFLSPGENTTIDILAQNLSFVDGQVSVGFGTSDVQIQGVKVLDSKHIQVIASAPVGQYIATSSMTITNGLTVLSHILGFFIQQP